MQELLLGVARTKVCLGTTKEAEIKLKVHAQVKFHTSIATLFSVLPTGRTAMPLIKQ